MKPFVRFVSFLLAFFVTLSIYILSYLIPQRKKVIYEMYTNDANNTNNTNDTTNTTNTTNTVFNGNEEIILSETQKKTIEEIFDEDIPKFPHLETVFMFLSTINNQGNISNNELKWYDNFLNLSQVLKTDFNKGTYFSLSNPLTFKNDELLPYSKGADMSHTSLIGPTALYFANNDQTFKLTEFSVVFMMKITSVTKTCTIFEMLCNTRTNDTHSFVPQAIALSISRVSNTEINFIVTVGSNSFTIKEIDQNSIINDIIHTITLTYDGTKVNVFIDNREYSHTPDKIEEISLGSTPVVINKSPELDCILYGFAYYKQPLKKEDILDFQKFITYYLSGLDIIMREKREYIKLLQMSSKRTQDSERKFHDMSKQLDKCSVEDDSLKNIQDISVIIPPKPSQM
jgi:hypothetical protein